MMLNPPGSKVVFENPDDLEAMVDTRTVRVGDAILIRGAGVDPSAFTFQPEPAGEPVVVLVARMLWDKGVGEFVAAARRLKAAGVRARFLLVGMPDSGNPASIEPGQLSSWHSEGAVEWLGHRDDVATLLARSHVVCLPSYREGLPKALLEALSAGRPIVTTNVPGCREVVEHEENGLLVPAREIDPLVEALRRLIHDKELRERMGARGRQKAEREFSNEMVVSQTLALYSSFFGADPAAQ